MALLQAEMDALVKRIKPHGEDIREGAGKGDKLCRNIMSTYQMLRDRPEAGALGILQGLMDDYIKEAKEVEDLCPECGAPLRDDVYSGIKCSKCDYWFCF